MSSGVCRDSPTHPGCLRLASVMRKRWRRLYPKSRSTLSTRVRWFAPLPRLQPLADALKLPVNVDDRLQEINIGIFQGLLACEIGDVHPEETARWRLGDPDFRIPGGESRKELMRRAEAAFEDIRNSGHKHVAVVAHGGVLAGAFKACLRVPPELNPFMLYNGSISRLEWETQVKLMTLNQTDHLRVAGCELTTRTGDL